MVAAAVLWVMWLTFCFGTVIVGLVMLFIAPALLMAPLFVVGGLGLGLLAKGAEIYMNAQPKPTTPDYLDSAMEDRMQRRMEINTRLADLQSKSAVQADNK